MRHVSLALIMDRHHLFYDSVRDRRFVQGQLRLVGKHSARGLSRSRKYHFTLTNSEIHGLGQAVL